MCFDDHIGLYELIDGTVICLAGKLRYSVVPFRQCFICRFALDHDMEVVDPLIYLRESSLSECGWLPELLHYNFLPNALSFLTCLELGEHGLLCLKRHWYLQLAFPRVFFLIHNRV